MPTILFSLPPWQPIPRLLHVCDLAGTSQAAFVGLPKLDFQLTLPEGVHSAVPMQYLDGMHTCSDPCILGMSEQQGTALEDCHDIDHKIRCMYLHLRHPWHDRSLSVCLM